MNTLKSVTSTHNIEVSLDDAIDFHGQQSWELNIDGVTTFIESQELWDREEELRNLFKPSIEEYTIESRRLLRLHEYAFKALENADHRGYEYSSPDYYQELQVECENTYAAWDAYMEIGARQDD